MKTKKLLFSILCLLSIVSFSTVSATFVPDPSKLYKIIQTNTQLVIGGAMYSQVKVESDANSSSQSFKFIPVDGLTDTYFIQNLDGSYLNKSASSNWNTVFEPTNETTRSQWTIVGEVEGFRLLLIDNNKYLSTDGITSGSYTYCDKSADHANGLFAATTSIYPTDLLEAGNTLNIGDLTAVTANLTLPTTIGTEGITVVWNSSNKAVIDSLGTVTRPEEYDVTVKLTATLSKVVEGVTFSLVKEFSALVKGKIELAEVLVQYQFKNDKITNNDGVITVTDETGLYQGTLKNEAKIRIIGESKQFNVLDLGNGTGHFDLGTDLGKAVYALNDYSISCYFRIDDDYSGLGNNGNFIWNIANTIDPGTDPTGYMICILKEQRACITDTHWGGEQSVTANTQAGKGTWHHIAYSQSGNTGNLYIDGVLASTGTVTKVPSSALAKDGKTGTIYNWLGRSSYSGDVYLRKTLLYGFEMYSIPLTADNYTFDLEVPATLEALNVAYMENPDYVSASVVTEAESLTLGDLTKVESVITLPTQGTTDTNVKISWTSSHPQLISTTGEVNRPDYFDFDVKLTATLSKDAQQVTKEFKATVLKKAGTEFLSNLMVKYDFTDVNGATVKDKAEKGFTGTLMNDAKIRLIGDELTGKIPVLDLGDSIGYFDLGTEMGKVVSQMQDYTLSSYFRIDESYTNLTANGNFLWSLSNSANAPVDANGYIISILKYMSVSVTPGYYTAASGNQEVSYNNQALQGGWHSFVYTQKDTIGTIYIDGNNVASATVTNIPKSTLIKNGKLGTEFNWIGRSCYPTDAYLRKTLVTDFRLYNKALTDVEILEEELKVTENVSKLDAAYLANPNAPNALNKLQMSKYKIAVNNGQISISNLNGTENVQIFDISGRRIASGNQKIFDLNAGVYLIRINDFAGKILVK